MLLRRGKRISCCTAIAALASLGGCVGYDDYGGAYYGGPAYPPAYAEPYLAPPVATFGFGGFGPEYRYHRDNDQWVHTNADRHVWSGGPPAPRPAPSSHPPPAPAFHPPPPPPPGYGHGRSGEDAMGPRN
jgi:hypothetical protein